MFFALENGADMFKYHESMYNASHKDKIDIEDIAVLSDYVKTITNADKFRLALENGAYEKELNDANDYAYEKSGAWYLPAFRMNGRKLDSKGGKGITKEQLAEFIKTI